MKRVLLLKPGVTSSKAVLGDYESWFGEATAGLATMHPIELHAGERAPSLNGFDAVIMTGSPLSVTEPAPWVVEAAEVLVTAKVPVLGVCFGHQLLAWRLGAEVRRNPLGLELGTVTVSLTEQGRVDPLFDGLPTNAEVQATHFDEAAALPDGATLLATNTACPVQAFRHGSRWGVQFHPEMNAASIRFAIGNEKTIDESRRRQLDTSAKDTPWGARILRNFVTRC